MIPKNTLSLKGTMAVALWNNEVIKNPRKMKRKKKKKRKNLITNKFNKLKRKSRKNKTYVPPKYQNLDWGWGRGAVGGLKVISDSFFFFFLSVFIELSLIYWALNYAYAFSGCHRKIFSSKRWSCQCFLSRYWIIYFLFLFIHFLN